MNEKRFKLDINLDDEGEALMFLDEHGTIDGRRLAKRLRISGPGSARLATAFSNYAWNKVTAIGCRKRGKISEAEMYETIADNIYSQDIQPYCECW